VDHFDVIVVGAGAAGCVAARRLTEDPARRVLLLEAGPDYGPRAESWPTDLLDPSDVPSESHPWGYTDAGQSPTSPKPLPRARVVGGSTTINACTWLRGSAGDFDAWAEAGNPGWSFADLLPYFRRAESDPLGGPLHGRAGPIPVLRAPEGELTPMDRAFIAAARDLGFPTLTDLNASADQRPGIGPRPQNVADGVRMNAALTYLAPARDRPNLAVVAGTLVDRIVLEASRAVGVRTATHEIYRADDIVLAGGAYGSPAILMRSGIGPANALRLVGLDVTVDLPGVGAHLLDHPLVIDGLGSYRIASESSPASASPPFLPLMLLARRLGGTEEIDVGIMVGQAFDPDDSSYVAFPLVCLLHARSEGRLTLTASDAEATLDIRHAHLTDPADLDALTDGVVLAGELLSTPAMASVMQLIPGSREAPVGKADLAAWLRRSAGTMFHPAGTCRMAPASDQRGVVGADGHVRGVDGLRIVDASVFPSMPRATIHFSVVAVAEKLVDEMARET
jgi:choline dehydrogenase